MTELVSKRNIVDYIPQRDPIVMVDTLYQVDQTSSITGFLVENSNIFVKDGKFLKCGVMEHIAQSAALRLGYIFKSASEDIPLGFIGSINNAILHSSPNVGDRIITKIDIIEEVFNITLINAVSKVDDEIIAECSMKIFLDK